MSALFGSMLRGTNVVTISGRRTTDSRAREYRSRRSAALAGYPAAGRDSVHAGDDRRDDYTVASQLVPGTPHERVPRGSGAAELPQLVTRLHLRLECFPRLILKSERLPQGLGPPLVLPLCRRERLAHLSVVVGLHLFYGHLPSLVLVTRDQQSAPRSGI